MGNWAGLTQYPPISPPAPNIWGDLDLVPPFVGRVVSFPVGEEIAGEAEEAIFVNFLPLSPPPHL